MYVQDSEPARRDALVIVKPVQAGKPRAERHGIHNQVPAFQTKVIFPAQRSARSSESSTNYPTVLNSCQWRRAAVLLTVDPVFLAAAGW